MKFIVIGIIATIAYFEVPHLISQKAYIESILLAIIAAAGIYLSSWLLPNCK